MKLFTILILNKGAKVTTLKSAFDLQSFGYFQRSSVKEFMEFTAKLLVERTQVGLRASVKEKEYMCHVFVRSDSLSAVVIADTDYPSRVAFTLLGKLLDDFSTQVPSAKWKSGAGDIAFDECEEYLAKYQNPREADPMMKVKSELDETKIIMESLLDFGTSYLNGNDQGHITLSKFRKHLYNTIEQVLQRGEKLDDLVTKSEGLSASSKTFYSTARKTNSCCGW